jgi:type I restriction enzyme S subunit
MVLESKMRPFVHEFFHYAIRAPEMVASCRRSVYGVRPGQWRLMYPEFCRLRMPLPSIETQEAVVSEIQRKTEIVDLTVSRTRHEILILREYRTRLIADVVTGKLDVREFARTLPADISEAAAELASGEFGDDEFSGTDNELADELAGDPA